MGTGPLGLEMLIYGLFGLLASATASKVFRESVLTRMVLPVLCEYAATCLNLIYYKANVPGETLSIGILAEGFVPGELLLVAVFSPFIFSLLKRFSYPEEGRRASRLVMRN